MGIKARFIRQKLLVFFLLMGVFTASIFYVSGQKAAAGINAQMNFQGRLLNSQGAVVPDGFYNIQFKIYENGDGQTAGDTTGSPAGTLKWTETYLNNNSQGIRVQNGFLSVQLGSVNPFGSSINWDNDTLWLSMNIASTNTTCATFGSCSPDGEMTPMKRLSSTAYAMNASYLGGIASSSFLQIGQGVQTDSTTNSSLFINKTSSGNLVQFQSSGANVFTLTGAGDIALGNNADHTLSVATAAASTAGKSLTISGGAAGTGASALAGGNLVLQGGAGGGTNGNGGNLQLDAGAKNGTGTAGTVNIATAVPSTVQIGTTTLAATQTISIGNNSTAGSVTNVTFGSIVGSSATTIQSGTSGITLTGAVNASSTVNATSGFKYNGTAGASTTCGSGQYLQQQVVQGGITTSGTCTTLDASVTLQDAYDNSAASPLITLSTTGHGVFIRDASSTVGGNLFAIQNNAQNSNYFAVTTSGASVAGTFSASSTLTASNGLTLTTGALNLTATSGSLALSGLGASSISTGTNAFTFTSSNFNTTATGINGTAIGSTTASTGAFTGVTTPTIGSTAGLSITGGTTVSVSSTGTNTASFDSGTTGAVNVGTGANAKTVTVGSTTGTSSTVIQAGSAGITLTGDVSGSTTINATTGFKYNGTAGASTTCGSGQYMQQQVVQGGLTTSGTCTTISGATNLQNAYDNSSTTPIVNFSSTGKGIFFRDSAATVGGNLFAVQNSTGATSYLAVTAAGASVAGTFTASSTLTASNGLTLTTGALNLTGTSGSIALSGLGASSFNAGTNAFTFTSSNFNTTGTGINSTAIGATTASTGAFTSVATPTVSSTAGLGITGGTTVTVSSTGTNTASFDSGTTGAVNVGTGANAKTVTVGSTNTTSGTVIQSGSTGISLNGNTSLTGTFSGSSTINAATGYKVGGTDGASRTCASGEYLQQQVVTGGITTGGTCTTINAAGASATLQDVYNNSGATPLVTLTSTGKGIFFRDASTPVSGNLFAIQNNAQSTNFFAVSTTGATVAGTLAVTGTSTASVALNAPLLDVAVAGTLSIGTSLASTIQIGSNTLASGTQTINIGNNNTAGGTTNVVIGAGGTATGGTTNIQAKGVIVFSTNGTTRGTFDATTNTFYFGNGVNSTAPNNFTIAGTTSTTNGTTGAILTVQGGNATAGNTSGGNLLLSGGTAAGSGANGLVVLTTPTFSATVNDANCFPTSSGATNNCTIRQASVDNSSTIIVGFSADGKTATLPNPTISTTGRVIYITASSTSKDFTLSINGGGAGNQIAMRKNTSATMMWNAGTGSGGFWTAAGASSSTTLQAAYDNTLQSAGGAELVVSSTGNTNGLTIRDSATSPVTDGALLTVQSASAANLLSINSNVNEYSTDSGAEVAGATSTAFPTSTWAALAGSGSSSVSRYVTAGQYIATGQASVAISTSAAANTGVKNTLLTSLSSNTHYNVSFAIRQNSNSTTFTDLNVDYSIDGTTTSGSLVSCATSKIVTYSIWTKVNCAFTAPASGITSGNAILIRQATASNAHTYFIDNLSVTIAADYNYATDGGVDDVTNFGTNWTQTGGATVTRTTAFGNDASSSAQVNASAVNHGAQNKLIINPLQNTLYRLSVYVATPTTSFSGFNIQYSYDGGTSKIPCADYNTQTVGDLATSGGKFTQITCYVTTDANTVTSPYILFRQNDGTTRTFYVDTFSMTLATATTPNVQIGGGSNGGPVSLLTLDRGASAPIASNNDAFLGSMYYDTSLGKLQCYEADGWGACGSSPDVVVTISPEYTNGVMHGTGVGTMTSDICSSTLHINDGTSSQPTICGTNETFNFYKWTSPQSSDQTYSIYVTYQLPDTFKQFASGQTSVSGRIDSTNASVKYSIYKSDSATGLTQCGPIVDVTGTTTASWRKVSASGATDPSACGFSAGNSILLKIDVSAKQNASAYVGNLNFTYSNR